MSIFEERRDQFFNRVCVFVCVCVSGLPQTSLCGASHNIALIMEGPAVRLHALCALFHRFFYPGVIVSKPFNRWLVRGLFCSDRNPLFNSQGPYHSFFSRGRIVMSLYHHSPTQWKAYLFLGSKFFHQAVSHFFIDAPQQLKKMLHVNQPIITDSVVLDSPADQLFSFKEQVVLMSYTPSVLRLNGWGEAGCTVSSGLPSPTSLGQRMQ